MPEDTQAARSIAWPRRAASVARWCFAPAAIAFLVVAGFGARDAVENVVRHAQWSALIASVLLWSMLHLLSPVFTWIVLGSFGTKVGYREVLGIHINRLPARYLPGGVWHTVSRVVDLHQRGVSRSQLSAMVFLEIVLPVAVAITLGGAFLLSVRPDWRLPALCTSGGIAMLAACPLLLRHRALLGQHRMAPAIYLRSIAVTVAFWLIAASAFACYWRGFSGAEAGTPLAEIYGAYLLAWATGFVSIFAPQGLGVFESVAGVLLRGALPFGGAALLVAGFRAAILAADVIAYTLFSLLRLAANLRVRGLH